MPQSPINVSIGDAASNFYTSIRIDEQNAAWIAPRHGKYYASTYGVPAIGSAAATAGNCYSGANPDSAPVALSAGLSTTYTGLCLSNPAASGVNLVVRRVSGVTIVAPAAFLALGLIVGWAAAGVTTHTTPLSANIVANYIGAAPASGSIVNAGAMGLLDSACTLVGTPLWHSEFACGAATGLAPQFVQDLDDGIIVPPGGYVAIGGSTTGPTSGFLGSICWEELAP